MLKFFKTWTLPISMLAGAIGYFVFANVTFLEPTKPFMYTLIAYLTPFLIFAQLLLTFCKISVRELMPSLGMVGYCLSKRFPVWCLPPYCSGCQ